MIDYVLPIMLGVLVLTVAWLVIARIRVTPTHVAMVVQRVHFGEAGLRLTEAEAAVAKLKNPEEIVIPHEHAILVIDFPLTTSATIAISAGFGTIGFTRAELIRDICEEYANVYEAEEATAGTKTIPRDERTHKVRNRTDGVYGIHTYDLDDLVVTAARWRLDRAGTVKIELHVEPRERPPAAA